MYVNSCDPWSYNDALCPLRSKGGAALGFLSRKLLTESKWFCLHARTGGQTLGRCHPERSGFGKPVTKYTAHGPGAPGGSPWTPDWLTFNNDYFKVAARQLLPAPFLLLQYFWQDDERPAQCVIPCQDPWVKAHKLNAPGVHKAASHSMSHAY